MGRSTFLTHHGQVLLHIAQSSKATLREIANSTELTERTVYKIVHDLEEDEYVVKRKDGRRNVYQLNEEVTLGHRLYGSLTLAQLIETLSAMVSAIQRKGRAAPL
ncbi:MAG: helix-turn-helix transcriptional regulator [Chloroflexi bacterium]|nr:helix-turn-helix transcriptional regulator [Chloroflexota bacterium]